VCRCGSFRPEIIAETTTHFPGLIDLRPARLKVLVTDSRTLERISLPGVADGFRAQRRRSSANATPLIKPWFTVRLGFVVRLT
jgi:hypothetical protein